MGKKNTEKHYKISRDDIDFNKRYDNFFFYIVLIFIFICPFIYIKGLYNYVTLPQSAFVQVFTIILVILYLLRLALSAEPVITFKKHPLNIALLCFLIWTFVASCYAHNHYESFSIWFHWAACIVLFFLLQNIINSERRVLQILNTIYLAGFITAMIGICQYLFNIHIIPQSAPPSATFANKNMAAQFITLTFPMGIALLYWSKQKMTTWYAAMGTCTMIIFLVYTRTRAAWVSVFVEFILCLIAGRRMFYRGKAGVLWNKDKTVAAIAGIFFIILFINAGPRGFKWQFPSVLSRALSGLNFQTNSSVNTPPLKAGESNIKREAEGSISLRFAIWQNTIKMIQKKPLTGYGLGNHKIYYPLFHSMAVHDKQFSEDFQLSHVHNDFLQLFSETGLIGVIAALFVFLSFFAVTAKLLRLSDKGHEADGMTIDSLKKLKSLTINETLPDKDTLSNFYINTAYFTAMVTGISIIGILINSCFSFPFEMPIPPLILTLYFVTALCLYPETGTWSLKPYKTWIILLIIIVTSLLYYSVKYYKSDIKCDEYYFTAKKFERLRQWKTVIAFANKAYSLNPNRKKILSYSARGYIESGEYQKGINDLTKVIKAYPYHMNAILNMGVACNGLKQYDKAMIYYKRALRIKKDFSKAFINMAGIYMIRKQYAKAVEYFKKAIVNEPGNAMVMYNMGLCQFYLKRYRQAEQSLAKTIRIKPDWADAQLNLAILYYQYLNKKQQSVPYFKKALELNPNIKNKKQIKKVIAMFSAETEGK